MKFVIPNIIELVFVIVLSVIWKQMSIQCISCSFVKIFGSSLVVVPTIVDNDVVGALAC